MVSAKEEAQAEKTKPVPLWWFTFWTEYLKNGNNAREAYLAAKPHVTIRTADTESSKLLRDPKFVEFRRAQEDAMLSRADRWQRDQVQRCERYRGDIDASRDQIGMESQDPKLPNARVIDPECLVDLVKVEEMTDRIARRSLGLDIEKNAPVVHVSVFSALGSAREKLVEEAEVLNLPAPDKVIDCDIA